MTSARLRRCLPHERLVGKNREVRDSAARTMEALDRTDLHYRLESVHRNSWSHVPPYDRLAWGHRVDSYPFRCGKTTGRLTSTLWTQVDPTASPEKVGATTLQLPIVGSAKIAFEYCGAECLFRQPFTFRRRGRSGRQAWPRPCPWPRTPRRPPVAHYP